MESEIERARRLAEHFAVNKPLVSAKERMGISKPDSYLDDSLVKRALIEFIEKRKSTEAE
jgi:hypothetical protein